MQSSTRKPAARIRHPEQDRMVSLYLFKNGFLGLMEIGIVRLSSCHPANAASRMGDLVLPNNDFVSSGGGILGVGSQSQILLHMLNGFVELTLFATE